MPGTYEYLLKLHNSADGREAFAGDCSYYGNMFYLKYFQKDLTKLYSCLSCRRLSVLSSLA